MHSLSDVFNTIRYEREHQDEKWGSVEAHPHEIGGWLCLMRSLLQDAESAWTHATGKQQMLLGVLEVVSTGVACLQQHGTTSRQAAARTGSSEELAAALATTPQGHRCKCNGERGPEMKPGVGTIACHYTPGVSEEVRRLQGVIRRLRAQLFALQTPSVGEAEYQRRQQKWDVETEDLLCDTACAPWPAGWPPMRTDPGPHPVPAPEECYPHQVPTSGEY